MGTDRMPGVLCGHVILRLKDHEQWKQTNQSVGLLQTEAQLRAKKTSLLKRLDDMDKRFDALKEKESQIGLNRKELKEFNLYQQTRMKVGNRLQEAEDLLDQHLSKEWLSPIYYNKARLLTDEPYRKGLEEKFAKHLRTNPARVYDQKAGKYLNRLVDNPRKFAQKTVANILEEHVLRVELRGIILVPEFGEVSAVEKIICVKDSTPRWRRDVRILGTTKKIR